MELPVVDHRKTQFELMMPSTFNSKTQERNWLELPADVTANILKRISMIDVLENAENVCTAWRKICTDDPTLWRVIDMRYLLDSFTLNLIGKRFKRLVDRSQGQLVDITIADESDDELLLYVAHRSSQLRRLVLAYDVYYIDRNLAKALMKFPILEELSFDFIKVSKEVIESAGRYCPMLKTFKVSEVAFRNQVRDTDEKSLTSYNEIAIAIGENLGELRHLEIIGNNMSNIGLEAILDGCRHLETLDLQRCFYIDLKRDLGKRCSKQIKVLKLSQEPLEYHEESEDEDDYYVDSPEKYNEDYDGYLSF